MELDRLAAALGPAEVVQPASTDVRRLAFDARAVVPGTLFFCVPGSRADGHDFAADAVARGAVALVVERPLDLAVPQLVVADARRAMAVAADAFFGDPTRELEVAGVTGTNGKTTTAYLLYAILEAAGRRPGLLGTIERRVGGERRAARSTRPRRSTCSARSARCSTPATAAARIEATSHGSELAPARRRPLRRARLHEPDAGPPRLPRDDGALLRREAAPVRQADRPPAAVNVGDAYGRRLAAELRAAPLLTFALADDAEIRPEGLELGPEGARSAPAGSSCARLRGRFNVENALGAVAAARLLGIDDDAIAAGLEAVRGVPGRFERGRRGPAVRRARRLRAHARTRSRTCCAPRASSRAAACSSSSAPAATATAPSARRWGGSPSELADLAIVTSDNPRSEEPQRDRRRDRRRRRRRASRSSSTGAARSSSRSSRRAPGDVVVIAGKGHEQGQEFAGREAAVRRPRGRARGAARAGGCARDPAHDRRGARPRALGRARPSRPAATRRSPASRSTRAASRPGDLFVAIGGGARLPRGRARARRRRGARAGRRVRGARGARRAPSARRSGARVVGDHRLDRQDVDEGHPRTRSARPCARTVAAEASTTTSSACPLTLLPARARTPRSCVAEMGMRGLGQIAALARSRGRDDRRDHERRARAPRAVGTVERGRAGEGRADRGASRRAASRSCPRRRPSSSRTCGRDDIEVRRFGPAATCSRVRRRGAPRRPRTRRRARELELHASRARHHAAERARGARSRTTRSALPLDRAHEGAARSRSRAGAARSWRSRRRRLLINDAYNANPMSMRAALDAPRRPCRRAAPRRRARRHGRARPGRARATTARSGRHARRLGVDVLLAVGPLAARYGDGRRDRRPSGASAGVDEAIVALGELAAAGRRACSSRRRARSGSRASRKRSRGRGFVHGPRHRRRDRRDAALDPARPELHRLPAPQGARPVHPRGGAAGAHRQAGHADDGRRC